jgi:quinoprotein glucose dehydrogenase
VPTDKPEGPASTTITAAVRGDNLYANSLLAIDATTGNSSGTNSSCITTSGTMTSGPRQCCLSAPQRPSSAVAQSTKMSLLFIFNRETGEPIFGMEERPVPQSTVGRKDVAHAAVSACRNRWRVSPPHAKNWHHSADSRAPEMRGLWEQGRSPASASTSRGRRTKISILPGAQGGSNWMGMTLPLVGSADWQRHGSGPAGRVQPGGGGGGGGRGGGRRGGAPLRRGHATRAPAPTSARACGRHCATVYSKTPGPFNRYWNTENMWSCSPTPGLTGGRQRQHRRHRLRSTR